MGALFWVGFLVGPAIINMFVPIIPTILGYIKGNCGITIPSGLDLPATTTTMAQAGRARRLG